MVECKNCRVCVEPGTEICPRCGEKIEKTADEMFSGLGYEKREPAYSGHRKYWYGFGVYIETVPGGMVISDGESLAIASSDVILACAKLIEEMRDKNV